MSHDDYGAVIPAAGVSSQTGRFKPMLPVGDETIIRRVIHILQKTGISRIVVIGGYHYQELKKHLDDLDIDVIYNKDFGKTDMLYSIALGLKRLQKECSKIVFCPGDMSVIDSGTLEKIIASDGDVVIPTYNGHAGHPIMLSRSVFPTIISYDGKNGLRGALDSFPGVCKNIPVNDEGILMDLNYRKDYEEMLRKIEVKTGEPTKLSLDINIGFRTDSLIFDTRTAAFLELLDITGSMSAACHAMNLSYTKCWNMINTIESKMGVKVLSRITGGKSGGGSTLTDEGRELLTNYIKIQNELNETGRKLFQKYFETENSHN